MNFRFVFLKALALLGFLALSTGKPNSVSFQDSKRFKIQNNEDARYWMNKGESEIRNALNLSPKVQRAKNVIVFLGDGMSLSTVAATRIYKAQQYFQHSGEESYLTFEKFPHLGLLKTYNTDFQVPDSASTASALFTGVKTNYYTMGYDNSIIYNNISSMETASSVTSILSWAQKEGKLTGFVTNTRLTHATPSALYAHSANREWECDERLPKGKPFIKDIARQLIENEPGRNIRVILGGGSVSFHSSVPDDNDWTCDRKDGKNLIQDWKDDKKRRYFQSEYVTTQEELNNVSDSTEFLLGIFAKNHMAFEDERQSTKEPSLNEMTQMALKILQRPTTTNSRVKSHSTQGPHSSNGFVLIVEGGRIDHAHHDGMANRALSETLAMDDVIRQTLEFIKLEETLVIVTVDHSHGMTINGYPKRGSDIRGLAGSKQRTKDNLPYTILSYSNGPGALQITNEETHRRVNLSLLDTTQMTYVQPALIPMDIEIHSGEDVGVWAIGPGSELFHSVHEQNYVAHVIGYSACMGPYKNNCNFLKYSSCTTHLPHTNWFYLIFFIVIFIDN